MAKQIIRSIRKGSVQWNEEDRLQMVSMLAKAGYAVRIVRKEIPSSETSFIGACRERIYCFNGCTDQQQDGSISYFIDSAFVAVCNGWI